MEKIKRRIIPVSAACTAQQLYILGTYNPDGTLLLQTQWFALPKPFAIMRIADIYSHIPNQMRTYMTGTQNKTLKNLTHCYMLLNISH